MSDQLARHLLGKWKWFTCSVLIFAFVIAGVIVGLPHNFAARAAGAAITITPAARSYNPPDSLIGVTGSGYAANETVNVYWNYSGPATGTLEGSPKSTGSGSFTFYFTTPLAPTATYTIAGVGQTSGSVATGTFKLLPGLFGNPQGAGAGTPIQLTGNDFGAGETVNVYWNYFGAGTGNLLGTSTSDNTGSFTLNTSVPLSSNLATGGVNIAGVGQTSKTTGFYKFTYYAPTVALAPLNGSANIPLTVSAYGYKGREKVSIFWNNGTTAISVGTTDLHGYLAPRSFKVPAGTAPGSYPVKVVGQITSFSATNTYTVVAPSSSLQHSSGFTAPITTGASWANFGQGPQNTRLNSSENTLGSGNVSNLQLKWSATVGTNNLGSPSPVYANGVVYMAGPTGALVAYDATTGNVKWQFDPKTGFPNISTPLVDPASGLVFFGTLGHQNPGTPSPFYAVDAQTGALKWSVILPCNEFGEPTLAFQTIYIGTSLNAGTTGTVYALNEMSGKVKWHLTTGGGVWRAIAADPNTQTVFAGVGDPGFQILALDATTGAIKWQIQVPNSSEDLDPGSAMVFANGLVYFSDKNGYVYALHENDGSVAWATQIAKLSADDVSTPAVGSNGVLYVGSLDSYLYALNATTGAVVWRASNVGGLDSSPALANGVVYFASFNSNIYALDATTHAVLWTFQTGGKSFSSPIVVNGWLYCGSGDGKLYAFSL